jgi:hypothetical protein
MVWHEIRDTAGLMFNVIFSWKLADMGRQQGEGGPKKGYLGCLREAGADGVPRRGLGFVSRH